MRWGPSVPDGFLPVFSVDTEEQARKLLVAACETNWQGEFVARELAWEQSLENLYSFGSRLELAASRIGLKLSEPEVDRRRTSGARRRDKSPERKRQR